MWRALATSADPNRNLRELKRHVHRLYKHIHPDRLGQYPKQRAVNEASFQVLQSALDRHFDRLEARTGDLPPQAPASAQHLTFFATQTDGLKKAVIRFHESRLGHALHSLFEGLGLEPPPSGVLPGAKGAHFASLTGLVRHARQTTMGNTRRQEEAAREAQTLDDEAVVTRLALQRARGVRIALGEGLPGRRRLVGLFWRLARTLRGVDADVGSLVIELDGGFDARLNADGVQPWLTLGACASEGTWGAALGSEALGAACERSREYLAGVRALEAEAAKALGVRLVMHDVGLGEGGGAGGLDGMLAGSARLETYVGLLRAVCAQHGRGVRAGAAGASSLAVMVSEGGGTQGDVERGVLRVSVSATAGDVARAVGADGARVCETHARWKTKRDREERRTRAVRRALGIERLRRADGVGDAEWDEALAHMRADAGRLRGVLDGVPVVVGTTARVLADSGEVEIPFDYYRAMAV